MDFPKKQAQRLMPLYLLEYSEKLFENHPDPEAPWGGGGSDYTAGDGIDITNDVISVDNTIARKSDIPSLTGYATEQWVLDKGYITSTDLLGYATETWVQSQGYLTSSALTNYITTTQLEDALDDYALKTDIPENVSDLNNDAGYTTQTWVENQGYITGITSSDVIAALGYTPGTSNFSGSYNDLTNKPDLSIYAESSDLATVATSGSYNDLLDTPTIGHGVLTIQVNGVNVKQFSANETAAKTANIIVPTKTSDLTNDSGFITSSSIANDIEYIDLGSGSYAPVITQTIVDKIATNPKKYVLLYKYIKGSYTYGLNFRLVNETTTSYGYECYCVKRYNSVEGFNQCSEGFGLNIGKSPITSTLDQWTVGGSSYSAGTGINISGTTISVDTSTVALKSEIPTATSDLTNDSGFITGITSSDVTTALGYTPGTSNFSGNYNDLSNKPTIPTVNDNTITITQGGVTKGSFTLNQNTNQTIEVDDVPGMIGEVLFSSAYGTEGNITLSNSLTNYEYIDIDYLNNENIYNVTRVYNPNGKLIGLDTIFDNPTTSRHYIQSIVYSLSGTSMTVHTATLQTRLTNNASVVVGSGTIKITKVIGYKQNNAPIVIPSVPTFTTLFNDSNGSDALSITLSDSIANYNCLDIQWVNNDGITNSTRVYDPNGKRISVINMYGYNPGNAEYINKAGIYDLSGTSMTQVCKVQGTIRNNAKSGVDYKSSSTVDSLIKITKVVGIKY